MKAIVAGAFLVSFAAAGCGGSNSVVTSATTSRPETAEAVVATSACTGATATVARAGPTPVAEPGLTVRGGLRIAKIASVAGARELAALPNGDLLVGTHSTNVYLVPNSEGPSNADVPLVFAAMPDNDAAGVAFDKSSCTIFVGTTYGVYAIPYHDAETRAPSITKIARLRTVVSHGDDEHLTTSLAISNGIVYASIGSSCNACVESDPTRATIQQMHRDGSAIATRAIHFRNAIALTVNPASGSVWAGGAGQDALAVGHPYEFFDDLSAHPGIADYGWPGCEENHQTFGSHANCASTVIPRVELRAYSTIIGAIFYPAAATGNYVLPTSYRGGVFLTAHGSWHQVNGKYYSAPQVVFVAMNGDVPKAPVYWSDPVTQWVPFITGFQLSNGTTRIGRPTGLAVGGKGSLFVADDLAGAIYRVRP